MNVRKRKYRIGNKQHITSTQKFTLTLIDMYLVKKRKLHSKVSKSFFTSSFLPMLHGCGSTHTHTHPAKKNTIPLYM